MSIEHFPGRIFRTKKIMALTGWSRTTIWRKVRSGDFPAPLALGPNSNGWTAEMYASWLASLSVVNYAPTDDATKAPEAQGECASTSDRGTVGTSTSGPGPEPVPTNP